MVNMTSLIFLLGMIFTDQATLKIVIQNVRVGKGSVVVEIYNDEKLFLKKPVVSQIQRANSTSLELSFSFPQGTYAIAAYQDLNNNKKLDAGIFHIPKEPYGFSNNYRPEFSAPHYKDCSINVEGQTTSVIRLK